AAPSPTAAATTQPDRTEAPAAAPAAAETPATSALSTGGLPTIGEIEAVWTTGVLASLPVKIRSKWRGGRWVDAEGDELRFSVPNEWHKKACDDARSQVETALAAHFGRPLVVGIVVGGDDTAAAGPAGVGSFGADPPAGGPPTRAGGIPAVAPTPGATATPGQASASSADDEAIDLSELRDADDVATHGVDLVLREFGGELLEEDT
ncbi:MAG TPA: hypothetical protein VJM49_07230, partial [Acidimicrobiales bacterium]|nr:hypothetical protein [Acidimicrobiales bacterium]